MKSILETPPLIQAAWPPIKAGVLDLSGSIEKRVDVSGMDMTKLILAEGVEHVDVRNCRQLEHLILPRSVKEANVSGCSRLKTGFVMKGLLDRLILADSKTLYWNSEKEH